MVVPFDVELLRMVPTLIKSPYVKIEPSVYVMYYNALYYGLQLLRGQSDPVAQGMYLKVLEAVPAWLDTTIESDLDGRT